MQIDWLTVGAQWVNFLILMWLLRRFLYRPIVQAMDRRQQRIEARSEDARQKVELAERQARDYRDKLKQLETQRAVFLAEAREAANLERVRLIELTRKESLALGRQWRSEFEREKTDLQQQLHRQLSRLILATAHKALQDLTSDTLEHALFENFLTRLQALPDTARHLLAASADGELVLASSFELSEHLRNRVSAAVNQSLTTGLKVRFEALPESRFGLILSSPSYTLEWCLERYFDGILAELDNALGTTKPVKTHVE